MAARASRLAATVPGELLVARRVTADAGEARAFLDEALRRGHEGLVAKGLGSTYDAGARGGGWLKIKPAHTLDLVVLAAEWGHGRRRGWLSNLHLGARDPERGGFVMLGKTFKGMTDQVLAWQTERLLALALAGEFPRRSRCRDVTRLLESSSGSPRRRRVESRTAATKALHEKGWVSSPERDQLAPEVFGLRFRDPSLSSPRASVRSR